MYKYVNNNILHTYIPGNNRVFLLHFFAALEICRDDCKDRSLIPES